MASNDGRLKFELCIGLVVGSSRARGRAFFASVRVGRLRQIAGDDERKLRWFTLGGCGVWRWVVRRRSGGVVCVHGIDVEVR